MSTMRSSVSLTALFSAGTFKLAVGDTALFLFVPITRFDISTMDKEQLICEVEMRRCLQITSSFHKILISREGKQGAKRFCKDHR